MNRRLTAWLAALMMLCLFPALAAASSSGVETATDLPDATATDLPAPAELGRTVTGEGLDGLLTLRTEQSAVRPGGMAVMTVTVTNTGSSPITDVTLTARGWQTGASLRQGTWSGADWIQRDRDVLTLSSLAAGESASATYAGKTAGEGGAASCTVGADWLSAGEGRSAAAVMTLDALPASGLMMTLTTTDWPWKPGGDHTARLTLTNTGDGALSGVTVRLSDAAAGDRSLGEVIVTAAEGKSLKKKQQLATWTADALAAGQTVTLDLRWTAPDSLAGITEVTLCSEAFAVDAAGVTVTAADEQTQVRPGWRRAASELSVGSVTLRDGLRLLGGLAAVLMAAAVALRLLHGRKDKRKE